MLKRLGMIAVVLALVAGTAAAEIRESGVEGSGGSAPTSAWSDAGYGAVSVLTNVLYMPAKVVWASVGLVTGGLGYLLTFGNEDVAMSIWQPSIGGTWVVTPAMIRGDDPILFAGPSYEKK